MKIAYVAFSGERSANGGFNSLFELVSRTEPGSAVLITQQDGPPLTKWRAAGIDCQTDLIDQGATRWSKLSSVQKSGDKKNQLELIRKLPRLFERVPNAHLHFLGDFQPDQDPYSRKCQQLAVQLGIERSLSFHGFAGRISEWYQLSDCTLLASRREGMARCMIESLSCGTPVVSFDVTSAREILKVHQCGLVAQQGDYKLLFDKLHQICSNPEIRSQMGIRGSQVSRRLFSGDANLCKFQSLITT